MAMIPYAELVEALRSYRARTGLPAPDAPVAYAPPVHAALAEAAPAFSAPAAPPPADYAGGYAAPLVDGATDQHAAIAAAPAPLADPSPAFDVLPPEQDPAYDPPASDDPFGDLADHTQLTDVAMVAPVMHSTPEGHADSTSEIDVTADIDIDEES